MSPAGARALIPAALALLALAGAGCGAGDAEEAGDDAPASVSDTVGELSDTARAAGDAPTGSAPGGREAGAPAGGGRAAPSAPSDPPRTGAGPAAPAALTTTGTIHLTGTAQAPMPTLRTAEATWLLQGAAAAELRRLDGATVRVTGRPAGESGPLRPLEVASYEIESIDGDRPFVGRVDRTGEGTLVLVTGDGTLRLGGAGGLAAEVGARVWVVGDRSGDALSVASYGIIRPAG